MRDLSLYLDGEFYASATSLDELFNYLHTSEKDYSEISIHGLSPEEMGAMHSVISEMKEDLAE